MINWSELVTGLTVNSFVTINSKSYAYKNNVTLNAGPAINVAGNPAAFFSGTAVYSSNINDGRTRNALRMFIYNALNAESDYTAAQAAVYGNTSSTDEFLVVRTSGNAPLTGSATWPVHSSIVSGSREAALNTSTHRLQLVAIRDRNGHVRAWRAKSGLTVATAGSFATAYDKLTDAQIRTEFGLPAAATPLAYPNQTQTIRRGESGSALPAATGGTAPYNYALGTEGTATPATSWSSSFAAVGTAYPATTPNSATSYMPHLFHDPSTNKTHAVLQETSTLAKVYELNLTTGRVSSPVSITLPTAGLSIIQGMTCTPEGRWFASQGGTNNTRVWNINKTTGAATLVHTSTWANFHGIAAMSNTVLRIVSGNGNRLHHVPLTLNAARTSATEGSLVSSATYGAGITDIQEATYYNNRLYVIAEGSVLGTDLTANATVSSLALQANIRSLVNVNRDFYSLVNQNGVTNAQLYRLAATSGAAGGFSTTLPTGITFNSTSRVISVANSAALGAHALKLRVRDSASPVAELLADVALTVQAAQAIAVAGTFNVANKSLSLTSSGSGTFNLEAASGGTGAISYSLVSPPAGITLSGRTVTVAGSVAAATISLTARATWTQGSSTATADATFNLALSRTQAPTTGSFSVTAKTITVQTTQTGSTVIEAASGGTGTLTYSLVSPPAGITFNTGTRSVQITGDVAAGSYNLTARATWTTTEGSTSLTSAFTLTVVRTTAPPVVALTGTWNVPPTITFNTQSSSRTVRYTLPAATGGRGTISYSLVSPPAGVSLSGRQISFAPAASGAVSVTSRATWTHGSSTANLDRTTTFNIPRTQAPARGVFRVTDKAVELEVNTAGSVSIEAATSGRGTITYTLDSPPAGITLSGTTLSIAASLAAGSYNLTARAIWTTGEGTASATSDFTLILTRVAPPPPRVPSTGKGGGGMPMWMILAIHRRRKKKKDDD